MATLIYKTADGTAFVTYGLGSVNQITLPFSSIVNIRKKIFGGKVKLVLSVSTPSYLPIKTKYSIDYDKVSYPVTSTPDELSTLIYSENVPYANRIDVVAVAGQTTVTFDSSGYNDVAVFKNGSIQLRDTDYTYTSGTTITFAAALGAGDQIQILKIKK